MSKNEPREYRAMISDEGTVVRGRIPSTLVRDLGARPGDYFIFRSDGAGNVSLSLSRGRTSGKKSAAKGRAVKIRKRR
jgi:hypothetical protein